MVTELPKRRNLDKQNEEIINTCSIPDVLLPLVALIAARAPSSSNSTTQCFAWSPSLARERFILWNWCISYSFMHQFRISACLCNCKKRILCQMWWQRQSGTNHKPVKFMVVSLSGHKKTVIYMQPCQAGSRRPFWNTSRGQSGFFGVQWNGQHQHEDRLQMCVSCDLLEESHVWHRHQLFTKDTEGQDKRHSTLTHSP